ncbi:MAG TPA: threonine/serine dehydratase [Aggregatilineales bacterium]|nr:threonine/serine dehydratase [Aggregatilineales bacterium]
MNERINLSPETKTTMLTLDDVYEAQSRIAGYVRHTPLISVSPVKVPASQQGSVYLKLECMQISGSFKARGATNKLFTLPPEQIQRGIVTASGGNHGLGVAYAGWLAKCPVMIYLPANTPPIKAEKLEGWGARVIFEGAVWDNANRAAMAAAERDGLAYVHPFADPAVIAGQGTIAVEVLKQIPDIDVILVAIGGGGLISGVSLAAKLLNPKVKVIGIEPTGAPTLYASRKAGHLVELESINTAANTLAPRLSAPINFDLIQRYVDDIILVSDDEMREAARWLWRELAVAVELSGAAAMAALLFGRVTITRDQKVCALVCGAGTDGIDHL